MKPSLDWLVERPIAHRGLHDRAKGIVENTISAALAAIEAKCSIECDVQVTADGEAVVFHDFTLERLTEGAGRADEKPADAINKLVLRGSSDRVPRLSDWLAVIGGRTGAVIEIKSRFDGDLRLLHRVIEVTRGYHGPFALKSFDPALIMKLRESAPDIPRGIVATNDYKDRGHASLPRAEIHAMANLLHFSQTKPDFLSWHVGDLPCAAPFLCRTQLTLPVVAWTVRTAEERGRASLHADQMVFEGFNP
ncbi:MAG: glycerophosphodiester phosphodiesterase [Hyphomicrobiales bacterium]|nr:glycerophosphodiester phosphodiesterase [Hyphomicrobiales bacterium]